MVQQRCARRKYLRAVYNTDVHAGLEKSGFITEFTIMLGDKQGDLFWRQFTQRLYAQLALHPRFCLRAEVNCPRYFICQLVVGHVDSVSNLI